jgi:hypothetical protein
MGVVAVLSSYAGDAVVLMQHLLQFKSKTSCNIDLNCSPLLLQVVCCSSVATVTQRPVTIPQYNGDATSLQPGKWAPFHSVLHHRCNKCSLTLFSAGHCDATSLLPQKWARLHGVPRVASLMQQAFTDPFVLQTTVMQHLFCLKSGPGSVVSGELHHRCNKYSLTLLFHRR